MKYMVVALDTNYRKPDSFLVNLEINGMQSKLGDNDEAIKFDWSSAVLDEEKGQKVAPKRDGRKAIYQAFAENPPLLDWFASDWMDRYKTDSGEAWKDTKIKAAIEKGEESGYGQTPQLNAGGNIGKMNKQHIVEVCAVKGKDCGVNHFMGGDFGNRGLMTNIVGVFNDADEAEDMVGKWAGVTAEQGKIDQQMQHPLLGKVGGIKHTAVSTDLVNASGVNKGDAMKKHGLGRWNKMMVIAIDETKLPDKLTDTGKGEAGIKQGQIGDLLFHVMLGAGPKVDEIKYGSYHIDKKIKNTKKETGFLEVQPEWSEKIKDDYDAIRKTLLNGDSKPKEFPGDKQMQGSKYADKQSGFHKLKQEKVNVLDFAKGTSYQKRREELLFQIITNGMADDAVGGMRGLEENESLGTVRVRDDSDVDNIIRGYGSRAAAGPLWRDAKRKQKVPKNASIFDLGSLGFGDNVDSGKDAWVGGPRKDGPSVDPSKVLRSNSYLKDMRTTENYNQAEIAIQNAGGTSPFKGTEGLTQTERSWGARVDNNELQDMIKDTVSHKRPLMIWGPPGIGKSQAVTQVVSDIRNKPDKSGDPNFGFKDLRLSQLDDIDLRGIPIAEERKFLDAPKGDFGREAGLSQTNFESPHWQKKDKNGKPIPYADLEAESKKTGVGTMAGLAGYKGTKLNPNYDKTVFKQPSVLPTEGSGILFLDEVNQAKKSVQNAAFQLVLDRQIGDYKVPDGWAIVAAGNRFQDLGVFDMNPDKGEEVLGAGPFTSALNNRFRHVVLKIPEKDGWLKWAGQDADEVQERLKTQKGKKQSFDIVYLPNEGAEEGTGKLLQGTYKKFTPNTEDDEDAGMDSGMKELKRATTKGNLDYGDIVKMFEKEGLKSVDDKGVERYQMPVYVQGKHKEAFGSKERVAFSGKKNTYLIDKSIRNFINDHPDLLYAMDDKKEYVNDELGLELDNYPDVQGKRVWLDSLPKDINDKDELDGKEGGDPFKGREVYTNLFSIQKGGKSEQREKGQAHYTYMNSTEPSDHEKAYPSPRQWEFLSDTITDMPEREYLPVGTILLDNQNRLREIVSEEKFVRSSPFDQKNRYLHPNKYWATVYNGRDIEDPSKLQEKEMNLNKVEKKAIAATGVLAGLAFKNHMGADPEGYLAKTPAGQYLGMKGRRWDARVSAEKKFPQLESALYNSLADNMPRLAKKAHEDGTTDDLIRNFAVLITRMQNDIQSGKDDGRFDDKKAVGDDNWIEKASVGGGWDIQRGEVTTGDMAAPWKRTLAAFGYSIDKANGWGKSIDNPQWAEKDEFYRQKLGNKYKKLLPKEKDAMIKGAGIEKKKFIPSGKSFDKLISVINKYPDLNRKFNAITNPNLNPDQGIVGEKFYDNYGVPKAKAKPVNPKANAGNPSGFGSSSNKLV